MRRLSTRAAGLLILILGLWGGLVPFLGPYFHFALGPNHSWTWTSGRFWLSVLPAIVAVIGGLMLLGSGPRPSGKLGALLALAAGIWFAIGPSVSLLWASNATGVAHGAKFVRVLEMLTYHTLLGTIMAAIAGYALPGLVTRRAAAEAAEAEAEAEAAQAPSGAAAPAGAAAVTPMRGRTAHDDYRESRPLVAESEPVMAERERERGSAGARREPVTAAAEREPVAGEPELGAAEREPGAAEREPGAAERTAGEPSAGAAPAGAAPTGAAPAGAAPAGARPPTGETPTRSDSGARTAVLDRPVQSETQQVEDRSAVDGPVGPAPSAPTGDRAADPGSTGTVTMRRRRGGLLSRLRG